MPRRMELIDNGGTVRLTYYHPHDGFVSRIYWVPAHGGYVHQTTWERPGTLGFQVCERLSSMGNTLWATPDNLAQVIRREYRRMRRSI